MLPLDVNFPRWLTAGKVAVLSGLAHLKVLWRVWDLRTFILVSLALQIILIFLAPFRKKTANTMVIVIIWLSYLLADYVAIQAVGLIPNYSKRAGVTHSDLLAFWAPFLLVHLGGPDPITALALEDNELWLRTALHLVTYASATARVFFQSLPANLLAIPTFLMFIAGILKFFERTLSLYHARLTQFKSSMLTEPDPGPNYAKLMESYDSYLKSALPARFDTNPEPDQYNFAPVSVHDPEQSTQKAEADNHNDNDNKGLGAEDKKTDAGDKRGAENTTSKWWRWLPCKRIRRFWKEDKQTLMNVKLVRDAFEFFEKYKGLYVDLIFSFHDRNKSRLYFLDLPAHKAFTVMEMELNFTYEVFYTKMIFIHQKSGTRIRLTSTCLELLSLMIWVLFIRKDQFKSIDIGITYTLLVGAIIIDWIAFLMVISSDWQLAMLSKESEWRAFIYDKLLSLRERTWGISWEKKTSPIKQRIRRMLFRRWSESVFQFNLILYCVDRWSIFPRIFFKILPPIREKCEGLKYVSKRWFADALRDFIYHELTYKAQIAEDPADAAEICDSKGDWVLRSLAALQFEPYDFYRWTTDVEYDECLLLWHIATELLYQEELREAEEAEGGTQDNLKKKCCSCFPSLFSSCTKKNDTDGGANATSEPDFRMFAKTLSDYMMYLLNRQQVMMFAVAGINEVRFRDTIAEANIFFDRVLPKATKSETKSRRLRVACKRLMDVNTGTSPRDIKGDRSKSVLFDAVQLAKALKDVKKKQDTVGMWELMAKVWVELLSYSATHTRASAHAAQLKQGGELLTLVWLLMVHLGLGKQFRITQGNARSKLIISK